MKNIKDLTLTALLTAFICITSLISINVFGIPFSFALFGVFLSGMILKPFYATFSNVAYILIGVAGIPVFSGFTNGLGTLFGPSGGFVISYPLVAIIISLATIKFGYSIKRQIVYCMIALVICYAFGTTWYSIIYQCDLFAALLVCVVPFIFLDFFKIVFSCYTYKLIRKYIKK